ncbi:MAG: LacI family DNA-binding transcriptional regulator [Betaproteobacteria bacterium]|nr:LacI family DNA-binding transcriptional regulator [Betaproteobacteria bacterium]
MKDETKRNRPRLKEVADLAGVSTMTVTRALHAPHKVADATRVRVEAVVRNLGYTPDLTARGLSLQRTGLVGAVVPLLTNSLIAEIVQGLSDTLARNDFQLLVGATGFSARAEQAMIRAFLSRRVDAIYLSGITHAAESIRMLRQARIPCVEGGNLARRPIDMAVGYSNKDAARTVTRHLIERGYRPLGYIGAWPRDNDRARDRRRGFAAACKAAGITVEDSLCVETDLDLNAGARAMAHLLEQRPDVRAVFCSADTLAVGAIFEAQRRKLAIPGDIAIAGFDDLDIASQIVPALTTLRVPRYEIGRRAGEMICERLAGRIVAEPVADIGFAFVPRATA